VNTSLVCLAVLFSAPAAEEARPVYKLSRPFDAVIRSQSPGPNNGYDKQPMTGTTGQPGAEIPQTYVGPGTVVPNGTMITPQQNFIAAPPGSDPFMAQQYGLQNGPGMRYGANGPQPFQTNRWISRYNFGILPKESTEGGLGDFGVLEFDGDWEYAFQTAPGWVFSFASQFGVRGWHGPSSAATHPTTALPGSVFRSGWKFELASTANNGSPLSLSLTFNPSLNTDFEGSPSSNAWNWDGYGMLFYRSTPQWTWVFGAGFWDRVNDRVIPYAGFIWTPDSRLEVRAVLPDPRISYFMGKQWSGYDTWMYLRGEYHVEAYELQLETTGAREKVELEDYRILLGLRFDNGYYSSFIEGGWVLGRNVSFLKGTPGFGVSDGFIGRLGLRF
jgi:hypothetical protein